jgi:acetyl-CoA carboxylase biotin carboxylase subunit
MLRKVLVANRGEIALRVVRACRDLGLASVAVYSEADAALPFVRAADEAVAIGPAPAKESYLAIERLIEAAQRTGADALHPGYGFLSENAALARACEAAGITFVGPAPAVIEALGSKLGTRALMAEAGVPIVPGTSAALDLEACAQAAERIGYPVLVKPSGGGGGRGMRIVRKPEDLAKALETSRREAGQAFGDSDVYVEKLIEGARHIEVQIMADAHGNVVHVGDRDCSLQRRHQKVIEEAPAPGLSDALHAHVRELAVRAARAAGYVNAGTVEFLFDGKDAFYVLEVNTRIQVEHCVTEAATGIDLVCEQLRIAGGERLSFAQSDVAFPFAAIEARIYAEDPQKKFMPSPGRITAAQFPSGPWIREDRAFEAGNEITPYYDGMIAKLIAWGPTRAHAIARLSRALSEYRIEGIKTNLAFLRWLVGTDAFAAVRIDTGFIEREHKPEPTKSS